jgi:hypothetical protein
MNVRVQRVSDRCKRICGQKEPECYVNKKEQINCISDMVINKTSSVMMALSASLQMDDSVFLRETARESLSDACELSNWIKYLQIVPDLFTLSTLVLDAASAEKRTEIRYPLPKDFEGRINVIYNGMLEAKLVNFSQKGLQIISSQPIKEGTVLQCHMMTDVAEGSNNPFKATAMYCVSVDGSNICGARITEMQGSEVFNYFSLVHQFMLDMTVDY